jgi:hypothetical protein
MHQALVTGRGGSGIPAASRALPASAWCLVTSHFFLFQSPSTCRGYAYALHTSEQRKFPIRGVWSHPSSSIIQRTLHDSRAFSQGVRATIDALAPAAQVLQGIYATGGRARLILDFEGDKNIGDVIAASDLSRLAQLGVSLGIEVFPHGV